MSELDHIGQALSPALRLNMETTMTTTEPTGNMPTTITDLATDPFWSPILYVDGKLDPKRVANELCDFAKAWQTLGDVINARAYGMSGHYKMYTAKAIIECIDEYYEQERQLERENEEEGKQP